MYKNINGKEEKVEREFDNPQDFQKFSQSQDISFPSLNGPFMGLGDRMNFNTYVDTLLDKRLWLTQTGESSDVVDIDKYQQELQKIQAQKENKDELIKQHKNTLSQLKDYKKQFKNEWRDDMVEQIDNDINKVEAELKTLQK